VLLAVGAAHPGLRLVDFLSFAVRARRLLSGDDLVNGLYPVGYPALLWAVQALVGDVLLAGKLLSALAGALAVFAVARLVGAGAGLAVLASAPLLTFGSTEGTDAPAAALLLLALLAGARGRGALAGLALGGALLCRYTAAAGLPVLLLAMGGGWRARRDLLLVLLAATAPHWALAAWTGLPLLPDQGINQAIGASGGPPGGAGPWMRAWVGFRRAGADALLTWPARLGLLGLLWGLLQRRREAALLSLLVLLHLLGLSLYFSKARLVLPAALCLVAGLGFLLPRRLLLPLALGFGLGAFPRALDPDGEEAMAARGVALVEGLPGPLLSSSPWLYQREGGWLLPAVNLKRLRDDRGLDPAGLWGLARGGGFRHVALEAGRVPGQFPLLRVLLRDGAPPGFRVVARQGGWTVLAVEG
jgi:hypothetical protein